MSLLLATEIQWWHTTYGNNTTVTNKEARKNTFETINLFTSKHKTSYIILVNKRN